MQAAIIQFFNHPAPHLCLGVLNILLGVVNDSIIGLVLGSISVILAVLIARKII